MKIIQTEIFSSARLTNLQDCINNFLRIYYITKKEIIDIKITVGKTENLYIGMIIFHKEMPSEQLLKKE